MKQDRNTLNPLCATALAMLMGMSLAACTTTEHDGLQKHPPPTAKKTPRASQAKNSQPSFGLKRYKDRILLYAEFDANRRTPMSVNLVFVYDARLLPVISGLSAQEWFSQRQELTLKHSKSFSVVASEVLPGEKKHLQRFSKRQKRAAMIVVFSSYQSEGEHKVVIRPKDINYVYMMKDYFIAK